MANIMNASFTITNETKMSEDTQSKIINHIKENIAYDDYIDINDSEEDVISLYLSVKWSLDYIKLYLTGMCKAFKVTLEARGEEEGIGFYEVMNIDNRGKIIKHEELSF